MTAFSLFHQPSFEDKVGAVDDAFHLTALLAAMFSISARFRPISPRHTPDDFHGLAVQYTEAALHRTPDSPPPVVLLQAITLTTFVHLTRGAKGAAWRALGLLVRMAYELDLHLVDADDGHEFDADVWTEKEERRRLCWAIWELDVFASTVRRLPTASTGT